ncbi:MAG: hypothetical protein Q7T18_08500 [Sedimentisphaerales bacterium]|nr:hypothetical protein [Sedimentisphaerales bacterium]
MDFHGLTRTRGTRILGRGYEEYQIAKIKNESAGQRYVLTTKLWNAVDEYFAHDIFIFSIFCSNGGIRGFEEMFEKKFT